MIHSYYNNMPRKKASSSVTKFSEPNQSNKTSPIFQSQKMEALGQLAGGLAHDFRNILTVIIGNATILKESLLYEAPLIDNLELILEASKKAANLISGLLIFGREKEADLKAADLNEIMRRSKKLLSRLIEADITIQVSFPKKSITVMADANLLEMVFINLAINARDAMPDGGVLSSSTELITVGKAFATAHGLHQAGSYALITVKDNGVGMDENVMQKIFEPFFTTKEVGKGTGLGLAIVHGIIQQHKGYINVNSALGKGTTFQIYLPLARMEEKSQDIKRALVQKGTETILLAEDDEEVRKFIRKMLEKYGYDVVATRDGVEALKKFRENKDKIELVILDVIMPRKTGKQVYDELRKIAPNVQILFVSGYTSDILYKRGILEDGFNFITKPVIHSELLKKVRELLDNRQSVKLCS